MVQRRILEEIARQTFGQDVSVADPSRFEAFLQENFQAFSGQQSAQSTPAAAPTSGGFDLGGLLARSFRRPEQPPDAGLLDRLLPGFRGLATPTLPEAVETRAPMALQPAARVLRELSSPLGLATLPLGGSPRVVAGGLLGAAGGATAGQAIGGDTGELVGAIGGGITGGVPAVQRLAGRGATKLAQSSADLAEGMGRANVGNVLLPRAPAARTAGRTAGVAPDDFFARVRDALGDVEAVPGQPVGARQVYESFLRKFGLTSEQMPEAQFARQLSQGADEASGLRGIPSSRPGEPTARRVQLAWQRPGGGREWLAFIARRTDAPSPTGQVATQAPLSEIAASEADRIAKARAPISQESAAGPHPSATPPFAPTGAVSQAAVTSPPVAMPPRSVPPPPPGVPPAPPVGGVPPTGQLPRPPTPGGQAARLLPDPQQLDEAMDVAFQPNAARRLGERLANFPVARQILQTASPSIANTDPVNRALIGHAVLKEQGRNFVNNAEQHVLQIGNRNDVFGAIDGTTGFLSQGPLAGRSLNEIAERPRQFDRLLAPAQRDFIGRLRDISKERFQLLRRNGIDVKELSFADGGVYADRRVYARLDPQTGDLLEAGFVGSGPARIGGKLGLEKERVFRTVEEAQKAGFSYLPYDQAVVLNAQGAYRRVADKRLTDWLVANVPTRPLGQGPLQFGEQILPNGAIRNMVFTGPDAQQTVKAISDYISTDYSKLLASFGNINAVNRMFVLAGDASPFTIQLLGLLYNYPTIWVKSAATFGRQLVTAFGNPAAARRFRADMISKNRALLQKYPTAIVGGTQEFTEAFGQQGLLRPNTILGTAAAPLRPFQQAYESAMDAAGIHLLGALDHLAEGNPNRVNDIADFVNNYRGLTSSSRLGVPLGQRLAEANVLLAPRYRRATAAMYAGMLQGGLRGQLARRAMTRLVAGTALTSIGITIAKGIYDGKSPEQIRNEVAQVVNPASGRFYLWRVAGQLIGPGSKFVSDARLIARLITDPERFTDFSDFNENSGVKWVRGQLAGGPGVAWDIFSGQNYLGEPTTGPFPSGVLNFTKNVLAENLAPVWVQSAALEGGTIGERATRGGAEFVGMRGFPQGAGDILDEAAFKSFNQPYRDLEPYQRQEIRGSVESSLPSRPTTSKRDRYFKRVKEVDATRIETEDKLVAALRAREIDKFRFLKLYDNEQTKARATKAEAARQFGVEFDEEGDLRSADPNIRALAEYYALFDQVQQQRGFLDWTVFERLLLEQDRKWTPAQGDYILRNINLIEHATGIEQLLPASTRNRILRSRQKREAHARAFGKAA